MYRKASQITTQDPEGKRGQKIDRNALGPIQRTVGNEERPAYVPINFCHIKATIPPARMCIPRSQQSRRNGREMVVPEN
jgi:hypothetical protein